MPTGNLDGAVQIGEWIVTPSLDSISRGTETHKLEPRTTRLLMYLANSAGEVVSVDKLLNEVWTGVIVGSASVYQAVSQLRKLLGDTDPDPAYIATVPRKGYRLVAPVRRLGPLSVPISATRAPVGVVPAEAAAVALAPVAVPPTVRGRRLIPIALSGAVLLGIAAGVLIWNGTLATRSASANSIVVLPFIDMTAEKTDQSFCDGLTEELSNWLAQIPTLRVVARTSAFAFRGSEDVRKIGKALNTNHILEGSMRRSGDHVRVTVQLIDARNGYHLWSENFDRPVEDAIKIQDDISRSVAETLQVRLTDDAQRQLAARRTSDSQAYQLYLLGRHYSQQLTPDTTDRAADLYRQVIAADPKFAPAYTQLAYTRLNQAIFHELPIADIAAQVEPLIASALRLDNRLSAAYAVRGSLRSLQNRNKEALDDLDLAISLNPSDMPAIAQIGRIHLYAGRPRDALQNYDRAAALDPLNFALQLQRCTVLGDLARYDEAVAACERARNLKPGIAPTSDGLAWIAETRGLIAEALKWNAESLTEEPGEDFNLYWTRATFLLTVGLAAPARAIIELGRRAANDEDNANAALVRVAYREGGAAALRTLISSSHLDQSAHAIVLFEAAYAWMLLGDAAAAKDSIARALAAPDREPGYAESPYYARGERMAGTSYRIDLAVAELSLGDSPAAQAELNNVLAMLNGMIAAGVERNATYELRAKVYALKGQGDDAIRDLSKAVKLGWRSAWWATHEPYFSSLWPRSDFKALMNDVSRSNDRLAQSIKSDQ
jgi:TolB-like protein/DNA-binding winged helix-turn-helix (wHTH) protein/Tfp pilus assembly protein PilF